jgi:uncharacterized protein (TIGR00369 family)
MTSLSIEAPAAGGIVPLEQVRGLSGVEFMRALSDGRFPPPPIAVLLGFHVIEVDEGLAVFAATPNRDHYNPLGMVHGGYTATLLDSCMGCAVHTRLKPGQAFTTLELKVNFIRSVSVDTGPVRAEGKIIHVGGQIATAEGKLIDGAGRLLAHATTTCLIFPLPPRRDA